ncbi:MAG TPA: MarP family serine protease [Solirubrobacteraceae bacterium]|nr:MarP family serine protease [Solirubrobacteraceae bacterium]
MTALDWLIALAAALFAVSGYLRGLIVAALSLVGFLAGAAAGTRIAAALLSGGSSSPYAAAFGLVGALVAGGVVARAFEGIGLRLRRALPGRALRLLDGVGGAVFSAAIALGIAWVVGAALLTFPGTGGLRATIAESLIIRRLNAILPPSGALLDVIERIEPLPTINGPTAAVAPPRRGILASGGVRRAERSVVRVLGTACGLDIEGSGWVIAPDEVLTNAHVVAGETDTTVEAGGRFPALVASAILFDPRNDLAVLRVPGLGLPALALASEPAPATGAAILGYPDDGPFVAEAARIGVTQAVQSQDAYGHGPVERELTPVRGLIRPGNSGGPAIDAAGQVVTTVFAATTTPGPPGGYGVANAAVRSDLRHLSASVSTERCTS